MHKRILLVDGMALLFRGFFATAFSKNFMINESGVPTNGVQQFLRYFIDGMNKFKPTHVVCCWDMGSETFRTEQFPAYKANRAAPPEELIPQFELVKQAVDTFNLPNIGIVNYEADDIIGTLAKRYHNDYEIVIQTGDYDLLQLVDDNIHVAIMKKGIGNYDVFSTDNFFEKRGLHPRQIIEFKGLTGDSADNYPGIKGIGEKTALKLMQTYDNFDNILKNVKELTPGLRKRINENSDMFYLSKEMATIKCDLTVDLLLDDAIVDYHLEEVEKQMIDLGIKVRNFTSLFIENFID